MNNHSNQNTNNPPSIHNQIRQESPSSECSAPLPPRSKKPNITDQCYSSTPSLPQISSAAAFQQTPVPPPRVPIPPPRRSNQRFYKFINFA